MLSLPAHFDYILLQRASKLPVHKEWNTRPSLTPDEAQRALQQGQNVGIRLRPGQIVIDIDPRNGGDIKRLRPFGLAYADIPTVITPSHPDARHLYLRTATDLDVVSSLGAGIDVKHFGGYLVAPGSTHPNGGLYEVDEFAGDFDALPPFVTGPLLGQITRRKSPTSTTPGVWTPEKLAEMLSRLDSRDYAAYDTWFALMCAAYTATAGEGEDEFVEWSLQDELFAQDEKEIRRKWNHGGIEADKARGAGAGTILHAIAAAGKTSEPVFDVDGEFDKFTSSSGATTATAEFIPPKTSLDDMNERFFVVQEDGKLRVLEIARSKELDMLTWIRHSKRDFLEVCQCAYHYPLVEVQKGDKTIQVPLAQRWIENPVTGKRVFPGGLVFMPETDEERVGDALNLWRGFAVKPAAGKWDLLQDLIRGVLCNGDEVSYQYTLNWLARSVQKPAEPAGVAIVFKGIKGTGKGTLGRAFIKLFGVHGKHITSMGAITGRFNSHLEECVALFADEAYYAGDRSGESALKGLITEPRLHYEAKGMTPHTGRNLIHILMASNLDWVVPAGLDSERRYAVFTTSDEIRSHEFFDALNKQLDNGGYEAMLQDLLTRDISKFRVGDMPQTQALTDQKLESLDIAEQWIYELLNSGNWGGLPIVTYGPHKTVILAHDLQLNFVALVGNRRFNRSMQISIGFALKRFIPSLLRLRIAKPETRLDLTTERVIAYAFPDITDACVKFEKRLGGAIFNAN